MSSLRTARGGGGEHAAELTSAMTKRHSGSAPYKLPPQTFVPEEGSKKQ
jgi:hypothetical protein